MKIEFIFNDSDILKTSFDNIKYSTLITCVKKRIRNGYIYSYKTQFKTPKHLMALSELANNIKDSLGKRNFFLYNDELSEFINRALYPKFNKFERLLRKLYYIVLIKNKQKIDGKGIDELTFAQLNNLFFYDNKFMQEIRNYCDCNSFTPSSLKDKIDGLNYLPWWEKYFNNSHRFIFDNFNDIRNYRNKIMHARVMNYSDFLKCKHIVDIANYELKSLINEMLHSKSCPAFDPDYLKFLTNDLIVPIMPTQEFCEPIEYNKVIKINSD